MKGQISALEAELDRLRPLEALLAYMQESSNDKVLALLASDGKELADASPTTLPPSEVMERLVTLLQTCGEGVDDLGPDILVSEARACDMAAAGDDAWVEAIEAADRQRQSERAQEEESYDGPSRVRGPGQKQEGDDNEVETWEDDDVDAFAAEIAAVGTHLQQVCTQCGVVFAEVSNSDWACRWHPGHKKVDAAWNSVWSCCGQKHAMRGCSVGRHCPSLVDDTQEEEDSEA